MKKLIVMVVLVCLGMISYSEENGCGPTDTNTNKTKQTTPAKDTKKEKKVIAEAGAGTNTEKSRLSCQMKIVKPNGVIRIKY